MSVALTDAVNENLDLIVVLWDHRDLGAGELTQIQPFLVMHPATFLEFLQNRFLLL